MLARTWLDRDESGRKERRPATQQQRSLQQSHLAGDFFSPFTTVAGRRLACTRALEFKDSCEHHTSCIHHPLRQGRSAGGKKSISLPWHSFRGQDTASALQDQDKTKLLYFHRASLTTDLYNANSASCEISATLLYVTGEGARLVPRAGRSLQPTAAPLPLHRTPISQLLQVIGECNG